MLKTERQFRVVQMFCILVVLACFQVALKLVQTSPEITPIQWVLVGMGVWAIFSGFMLERQIVGYPNRVRRPSARSTPFSRWRAGNLVRVASATSVPLWGPDPARERWPLVNRVHFLRHRRIVASSVETERPPHRRHGSAFVVVEKSLLH